MREYSLGTVYQLKLSAAAAGFAGSIGLWGIVALAMIAIAIPAGPALVGAVFIVILHWLSELIHQLGHAVAARRTGYPMTGIRFGKLGIFATGLYPSDEPALPKKIHIRRALGGPLISAVISAVGLGLLLVVGPGAGAAGQFVLWFFFLENLVVMTLQVFIPLGFNDGATLWYWLRQR